MFFGIVAQSATSAGHIIIPVGAAGGLATVVGVGSSTVGGTGVGAASGAAIVSAAGKALAAGMGSASGLATISGVGRPLATGAGSSSGVVTVSGVPPQIALTFIGTAQVSGTSGTATFTNTNIGTASSDRLVIAALTGVRSTITARTLSSVAIGGNAATTHISQVQNASGSAGINCSISSLVVPSGTTATITAVYSGAFTECFLDVYTLTQYNSSTPTATNSNVVASGDPSTTINVTGTGVAIGMWCGSSGTSGSPTWTGLSTRNSDANVTGVSNVRASSAGQGGLSTETPRTISATSGMTAEMIVAASWH